MQPVDPADKRQPNVQIAASIRAAILNGELEPGAQLPTGHELAKFFGVSRMTVQTAVRTLREEGFVRSRAGSGVYVRDQASLPAPDEQDHHPRVFVDRVLNKAIEVIKEELKEPVARK